MTLKCPRCQSPQPRKAGISRHGHQRWLCKQCGRTFGEKNRRVIEPDRRAQALTLYAGGMSARSIERVLGVSHNSVLGWVHQQVQGQAIKPPPASSVQTLEMDQMWSYCAS